MLATGSQNARKGWQLKNTNIVKPEDSMTWIAINVHRMPFQILELLNRSKEHATDILTKPMESIQRISVAKMYLKASILFCSET